MKTKIHKLVFTVQETLNSKWIIHWGEITTQKTMYIIFLDECESEDIFHNLQDWFYKRVYGTNRSFKAWTERKFAVQALQVAKGKQCVS